MSLSWPLLVDLLAALRVLADPDANRLVLHVLRVGADPRRLLARRADDHHVRHLDRRRPLDDAARDDRRAAHAARVLNRPRTRVPLDEVDVLDEDTALLRQRFD